MSTLPPDPYPLPRSIPHAALAAAERYGDKPGLIENGRTWSFADLWADARASASAFLAAGVGAGDIVAIWADPSYANNELGWRAERSLDETLAAAWKWEKHIRGIE